MKLSFKLDAIAFNGIEINGISVDVEGTPKETAKTFSIIAQMAEDFAKQQADLRAETKTQSDDSEGANTAFAAKSYPAAQ